MVEIRAESEEPLQETWNTVEMKNTRLLVSPKNEGSALLPQS